MGWECGGEITASTYHVRMEGGETHLSKLRAGKESLEVERTYLRITFEGEALQDHEADLEIFAPALLSTASLLQYVNSTRNGDSCNLRFKFAGIEGNCISFDIAVVQSLFKGMTNLLFHDNTGTILALVGLIPLISGKNPGPSLIQFAKWLKNRKVKETSSEDGSVLVFTEDGDSTTIPLEIWQIWHDPKAMRNCQGMIKPLLSPGIDSVLFREKGKNGTPVKIEKEEVSFFSATELEERIENEMTLLGKLDRPSLEGKGSGWRLICDETSFKITVEDEDFLDAVKNNQIFFSHETLFKVTMTSTQGYTSKGNIKTQNIAHKVQKIEPAQK